MTSHKRSPYCVGIQLICMGLQEEVEEVRLGNQTHCVYLFMELSIVMTLQALLQFHGSKDNLMPLGPLMCKILRLSTDLASPWTRKHTQAEKYVLTLMPPNKHTLSHTPFCSAIGKENVLLTLSTARIDCLLTSWHTHLSRPNVALSLIVSGRPCERYTHSISLPLTDYQLRTN